MVGFRASLSETGLQPKGFPATESLGMAPNKPHSLLSKISPCTTLLINRQLNAVGTDGSSEASLSSVAQGEVDSAPFIYLQVLRAPSHAGMSGTFAPILPFKMSKYNRQTNRQDSTEERCEGLGERKLRSPP